MPDLIELGIDVLNCQASVMDFNSLTNLQVRLLSELTLTVRRYLPFVSPGEVKEYVFELFHNLGTPDGGIIACGEISEDVPLENIKAMYEAFTEFKW